MSRHKLSTSKFARGRRWVACPVFVPILFLLYAPASVHPGASPAVATVIRGVGIRADASGDAVQAAGRSAARPADPARDARESAAPQSARVPLVCSPRAHNCKGWGGSCLVIFSELRWRAWLSERREPDDETPAFEGVAEVHRGRRPTLSFEFKSAPPKEIKVIPVDRDTPLDRSVAESLGFKSVTVLKGRYRVMPAMKESGGVVFNVRISPP